MNVIAIIPARYGSSRFEGKPLVDILGKTMIQRVYEGVCRSRLIEEVLVATDDQRILDEVHRFGGKAVMTSRAHPTGTDRLAEVARKRKVGIVVNVQGDEPLIDGRVVDKAVRLLLNDETVPMSTLMSKISSPEEWLDPNVVKIVVDRRGYALYFSRSPIPFPRDLHVERVFAGKSLPQGLRIENVHRHLGIYVYRREFLLKYAQMKPTLLESLEKLEQLRALENGYRIKAALVDYNPYHVDTPEDLAKMVRFLSGSS